MCIRDRYLSALSAKVRTTKNFINGLFRNVKRYNKIIWLCKVYNIYTGTATTTTTARELIWIATHLCCFPGVGVFVRRASGALWKIYTRTRNGACALGLRPPQFQSNPSPTACMNVCDRPISQCPAVGLPARARNCRGIPYLFCTTHTHTCLCVWQRKTPWIRNGYSKLNVCASHQSRIY